MKNYLFFLIAFCMGLFVNIHAQDVRYVTENGQNWDPWSAHDWHNAYNDLQAVIDISSPGDIICVARGTYVPAYAADNTNHYDPYNRDNAFVLKNGVQIYGGFEGTEDFWSYDLNQRDFVTNETILSGMLPHGQNAYHVVVMVSQSEENSVLDGFTITGGHANAYRDICVESQCDIRQYNGGGVYVKGTGSVTLANNQIYNNFADIDGGGIYIERLEQSGSVRLIKNMINNNHANNEGGGIRAVFYDWSSDRNTFNSNVINDNTAGYSGGGISMYMENNHEFSFANNLISNNISDVGGGIYMEGYTYESINMTNNTLVSNVAYDGGGVFTNFSFPLDMTISNTIFWTNWAHNSGESSIESTFSSSIRMENCLLEEGYMPGAGYSYGNMNIFNEDPLFVDVYSADYHLRSGSPAINAGDNYYLPNEIIHDLYGGMRILDNTVDMGVAEFVQEIYISPLIDTIIYVNESAMGTNTGESWNNAFLEFADALVAAEEINADTPGKIRQIRVAKGTYSPKYVVNGGSTYKDRSFVLPVNVKVYGGFAGTESATYNLKRRDFAANTSILSGYCSGPYPENVYHVVIAYVDNATDTVLLDGFTITGGEAQVVNNSRMSGNNIESYSPEEENIFNALSGFNSSRYSENVRDAAFADDTIDTALLNSFSRTVDEPLVYGSSRMSNNIYQDFYSEYGAGLYAKLYGGTIIVTNNTVTGNNSRYGAGGLHIEGFYNSKIIVANNTITYNSGGVGAGIYTYANTDCDILILNNWITNNSGYTGGGLYAAGRFSVTINIVNNLIAYNQASSNGGGIGLSSEASTLSLTNNTIVYNQANSSGGGIYMGDGTNIINNSIIFGNRRNGVIDNIFMRVNFIGYAFGKCYVNYCLLENATFSTGVINNGNNILGQNPLFVNSSLKDYRLHSGSPAINAGNNVYVPLNITTDLDGKSRILEGVVDIGAYESGVDVPVVITPDYDTILYVNKFAEGDNTGENWENAYNDFSDALYQAEYLNYTTPGTIKQIWVAQGEYKPDSNSSFKMVSNVSIYGGFAGNEPDCQARDYVQNKTILKGNGSSVIYNNFSVSDNLVHARLDGFTITGGTSSMGGGINNQYASPTIANCVIERCTTTSSGGGIYNNYSNAFIYNTIIQNNQAGMDGGGVTNNASSSYFLEVTIKNNTVLQNTAGGMFIGGSPFPTLESCIISGNKANGRGGGIFNNGGGSTLINVLVTGNYAGLTGGGIFTYNATIHATNVTISGNSAAGGSGGVRNDHSRTEYSSHFYAKNSIIWGNKAGNTTIDNIYNNSNCFSYIASSLIENSNGSGSSWNSSLGTDQGGNKGGSPDFVDYQRVINTIPTTAGDFRLQNNSSCINAGNNVYIPSHVTTDLDGKHRIIAGNVDMGAYEWGEYVINSDTILYVSQAAEEGTNTGESWANAYLEFSEALLQAETLNNTTPGTIKQIWVAKGVYVPRDKAGDGTQDYDRAFVLPANVKVYGGFEGIEPETFDLSLRKFTTDETILNGNINTNTDVYHVVIGVANAGEKILLDGFIIKSGNADGPISYTINVNNIDVKGDCGGGIYVAGSGQVTLYNNEITENEGWEGAIYADVSENGNVMLNNNIIINNTIWEYGGGISIHTDANSTVNLNNNIIKNNSADSNGGGIYAKTNGIVDLNGNTITNNSAIANGGGMYLESFFSSGNILIRNNTVDTNHASIGGGIYEDAKSGSKIVIQGNNIIQNTSTSYGSGIYMNITNTNTSSTISHNTIINNTSPQGSGVGIFVNLLSQGDAKLLNNLIANNKSASTTKTTLGGGIYVSARTSGQALLVNNTVADNVAQQGAGLYADISGNNSKLEVQNTIFWNNNIFNKNNNSSVTMDYCLVEQPLSIPSNIVNPGNNVINSNFPFASSTDYRIGGTNSPAYNAGNEAFTIAAGITEDLNGELRILDNRVDIGAYEYQSSSISSQKGNSGIDENEDYANVEDAKKQKSDQENHSIVVYPNPASYTLYIQSLDRIENLIIYDINGRIVEQQTNNKGFIDVSYLTEGVYLLKINTAKTEVVKRFIKR